MLDKPGHQVTLLRHGESMGNRDGIIQGHGEFPLTTFGRSQILALAEHWRSQKRRFDLLIASPQARALQTAQILAVELDLSLEENPSWMERNAGDAEGRSADSRSVNQARWLDTSSFVPLFPNGESSVDLHIRALKGIENIVNRPPGSYLVVSHGGILNAAVRAILGMSPSGSHAAVVFHFDNAAYMDLTFSMATHTWHVVRSNTDIHLANLLDD